MIEIAIAPAPTMQNARTRPGTLGMKTILTSTAISPMAST